MKKLLAIAPYSYLPYYSGGQKFIAQFFEYLGKETELTVISVAENDFSLAKNHTILPWLKKNFNRYLDASLPSKIAALIQKENFDYIIWEHPYFAWAAYRVKQKTGIKTIIHTHNIEHQRFRSIGKWWWPVLKQYEKWSFNFSDYILFVSPEEKEFALREWKLDPEKCIDMPFGIEIKEYPKDRAHQKEAIKNKYQLANEEKIFLFNGLLSYQPNLDALKIILETINPLLLKQTGFKYKIIICGKGLPENMNELKEYYSQNVIYAGFVDNIESYFKAADVFLNPVETGGGIKTKMIEAIALGTTVVSTSNGARGINRDVCGNKLIIVDGDWSEFSKAVLHADSNAETPSSYYNYYHWENIIQNLLDRLTDHMPGETMND
jgi:glycosyltransferase involved in cell wall biosynthesis